MAAEELFAERKQLAAACFRLVAVATPVFDLLLLPEKVGSFHSHIVVKLMRPALSLVASLMASSIRCSFLQASSNLAVTFLQGMRQARKIVGQ